MHRGVTQMTERNCGAGTCQSCEIEYDKTQDRCYRCLICIADGNSIYTNYKPKQGSQPADWDKGVNAILSVLYLELHESIVDDVKISVKQLISTLLADKDKEIAELKRRVVSKLATSQ